MTNELIGEINRFNPEAIVKGGDYTPAAGLEIAVRLPAAVA